MKGAAWLASVLPLLAFPSAAAELRVPGDYPNLQAAIDAAAAGDVIVVSTGYTQDPVVIDKALTILGDPMFSVRTECGFPGACTDCPEPDHAFRLAGPGTGRVVIGNAQTTSFDCFYPAASIGGGGFDELHLFNVEFHPVSGQTGLGYGSSTIQVDVPHVLVEGSSIRGGIVDCDHCSGFLYDVVYAAIEAPASAVTILNSEVVGGGNAYFCCQGCTCPAGLPEGGKGGNGVVASEVFVDSASTVAGGAGSTFYAYPGPAGTGGVACGKKRDGVAFIAGAVHALPGAVTGSGATRLGGTFTLSFEVPGPLAVLYLSLRVGEPVLVPGSGYSYLHTPVLAQPVTTGSPQTLAFAVPPAPELVGLERAFQILDFTLGLTAPAVALLGP